MEYKKESKTVRDARGTARRMARNGGGSYQKCLDVVAQDAGHQHWKAFMAAHPPEEAADVPTAEAAPARRRPPPFRPVPYEQWRGRLEVLTRNEFDEARVERTARRAERLAERLQMPLWVVGCAPMAAIGLVLTGTIIGRSPDLDDVVTGMIGMLASMMICFICFVYGDSRTMSGLRSSTGDFLGLMQMLLGLYLLVYVVAQMGGSPKIIQAIRPYFGTPIRTFAGVLVASFLVQIAAMSMRWMMVTASRYPSRSPTERRGGAART